MDPLRSPSMGWKNILDLLLNSQKREASDPPWLAKFWRCLGGPSLKLGTFLGTFLLLVKWDRREAVVRIISGRAFVLKVYLPTLTRIAWICLPERCNHLVGNQILHGVPQFPFFGASKSGFRSFQRKPVDQLPIWWNRRVNRALCIWEVNGTGTRGCRRPGNSVAPGGQQKTGGPPEVAAQGGDRHIHTFKYKKQQTMNKWTYYIDVYDLTLYFKARYAMTYTHQRKTIWMLTFEYARP